MPILNQGQLDDPATNGWVIGHMATGALRTADFGVKWKKHSAGLAGDGSWSICINPNTITLSVLISGHFRIHFREHEGADETVIDLTQSGEYVLFQSPTQHWSEAITESTFLTIRWPSEHDDCGSILKEPWASAGKRRSPSLPDNS